MSIYLCPVEILDLIARHVIRSSLLDLRTVNKMWYAVATPLAFHRCGVYNRSSSINRFKAVSEAQHLAKFVKCIVFRFIDDGYPQASYHDELQYIQDVIVADLGTVFSQLHKFPTLHDVKLSFSQMNWTNLDYFSLQWTLPMALVNKPHPQTLTSLTLKNLLPLPFVFYETEAFARVLSSLRHLSISMHGLDFHAHGTEAMWSLMWSRTIPLRVLTPPQPQLTSLILISDQPVGVVPLMDLSGLFYPALRRLTMGGMTFDEHRCMEDFIVRHRATLNSLVLDSCPMFFGTTAGAPHRSWATVCARFQETLENLVELQVWLRTRWGWERGGSEPREKMRLTYEPSPTGYGYTRGQMPLDTAVVEADQVALEKFAAAIKSRKKARGL